MGRTHKYRGGGLRWGGCTNTAAAAGSGEEGGGPVSAAYMACNHFPVTKMLKLSMLPVQVRGLGLNGYEGNIRDLISGS